MALSSAPIYSTSYLHSDTSAPHAGSSRPIRRRSKPQTEIEPVQHLSEASLDVHARVYSVEQFWQEIEEVLVVPDACSLTQLDNTLRMFVTFCAAYHDEYLTSAHDMYHAIELLLDSELFTFHNERMVGLMMVDAQENTNPHELYILYHIVLYYGQRHSSLFRSHRKWRKLLPTLGEVLNVEIDETFVHGLPPIESRLRLPATDLMYEVCRVQKLSAGELAQFDDQFIDHLFEMVETTRDYQDERLNYAVIRLIVALNEQFMVATLPTKPTKIITTTAPMPSTATFSAEPEQVTPTSPISLVSSIPAARPKHLSADAHQRHHYRSNTGSTVFNHEHAEDAKKLNRVLIVLMRRLGSSKTFGENVIFMLNRAENTPEGLCMQLLTLKILYLLFTTPGTQEYFYTNDLRVLLDVFIRELVDLPEEAESLRHTYLRVLYPLLNHTQLRNDPYKRPQIKLVLRSLISQGHIRDVKPTTVRLVERCLEEPKKLERSHSAEDLRQNPTCSTISFEDVTRALPKPSKGLQPTSIYTSCDPVRTSSLMDVSETLHSQPTRPRSASSATSAGHASDASEGTVRRRKAPAPPSKKYSASSAGASGDERSNTPRLPGTEEERDGSHRDLVEVGGKRIPPPIIEVHNVPIEGWITFST